MATHTATQQQHQRLPVEAEALLLERRLGMGIEQDDSRTRRTANCLSIPRWYSSNGTLSFMATSYIFLEPAAARRGQPPAALTHAEKAS